ncbi:SDR family NAD(P)-dependent oxidoreductase [Dactylosporangium sp. CA-092794]|uniref:SDR family NAD(P)-dependent oxidoreductase n=1 Tax=Dactylosporangium sp. CA-092794 TaxID=3239929 RepID=UPI003D8D6A2A
MSFDDLRGKTALVTGSSRGIGAGLADALEHAGARVLRHGPPAHAELVGPGSDVILADLSSEAGVETLSDAVKARVDRLDVLVNNAGVEIPQRLATLSERELRTVLDVNLVAPMLLARSLLPLLRASTGGSIVNITSIHDDVPVAGNLAYMSSKAGLAGATRTMALELAPLGIRVNCLAPGAIETDMAREAIETMGRDKFESWIPLGRVGTVDDVVAPLLFLASDASRYVTGTRLLVDGGYSLALLRYGLLE